MAVLSSFAFTVIILKTDNIRNGIINNDKRVTNVKELTDSEKAEGSTFILSSYYDN